MTHPTSLDAFWILGTTFFFILVVTGMILPLYAAIFTVVTERTTRLDLWLRRFGMALIVLSMVIVGGFAVGLGLMVMARVWRLT